MKVPCTISAGTVFGRMWRISSSGVRVPAQIAGLDVRLLAHRQHDRAHQPHQRAVLLGTMIATITLNSPARNNETSAIASRIAGDCHQPVHQPHHDGVEPGEGSPATRPMKSPIAMLIRRRPLRPDDQRNAPHRRRHGCRCRGPRLSVPMGR